MMNFKNEEAVSPVIGVILMVAITVILAAVIAAFVFGMTGNVQTTKTVSIGSQISNTNIILTINGGPDLSTLQGLTIKIGDAPAEGSYKGASGSEAISSGKIDLSGDQQFKVGDTITINKNSGRLLVVGKWSDGAEQIIIDRTY